MPAYVIGTSAIRLLVPLYVFGCPDGSCASSRSSGCAGFSSSGSRRRSRRWRRSTLRPEVFHPRQVPPEVYDYHRRVEPEVLAGAGAGDEECGEAGGVDCVICMNTVGREGPEGADVTPYNHFFHQECLERGWR